MLVGVTGLELNRSEFYAKELTFQVSCSYGPGRYDPNYEEAGNDYPVSFVRWTEQRNFEAVLGLLANGDIATTPLVSHRFPIERAPEAYEMLAHDPSALGILLEYPKVALSAPIDRRVVLRADTPAVLSGEPVVGFIGAGNYGSRMLIPAFRAAGAVLDTLVTSTGASGVHHGRKNSFATASTQLSDVMENKKVNTVVIVTRHNSHAALVTRALEAGKHVFVEKPLALTLDEIAMIEAQITVTNELPEHHQH